MTRMPDYRTTLFACTLLGHWLVQHGNAFSILAMSARKVPTSIGPWRSPFQEPLPTTGAFSSTINVSFNQQPQPQQTTKRQKRQRLIQAINIFPFRFPNHLRSLTRLRSTMSKMICVLFVSFLLSWGLVVPKATAVGAGARARVSRANESTRRSSVEPTTELQKKRISMGGSIAVTAGGIALIVGKQAFKNPRDSSKKKDDDGDGNNTHSSPSSTNKASPSTTTTSTINKDKIVLDEARKLKQQEVEMLDQAEQMIETVLSETKQLKSTEEKIQTLEDEINRLEAKSQGRFP